MSALRALERFAKSRRNGDAPRCDLCAGLIAARHRHAVDVIDRRLVCICAACAVLLADSYRGRYRTVPTRVRVDPAWTVCDADLTALGVPVGLAFFFRSSWNNRWSAILPSPAGPTEAEIDDAAWKTFAGSAWLAGLIEDDVEALLVRRVRSRGGSWDSLVVPIDVAYEIAGLVRKHWRGVDGGEDAHRVLDDRVAELVAGAELVSDHPGAFA
jgi:hypothetical protein